MEMSNSNPGYPPSSSVNNPAVTNGIDPSKDPNAPPAKRRPGRPKGSTNKKREGEQPPPPSDPLKVKRPVGRPRKDGFPAGSVNAPRPAKQPRLSNSPSQWTGFTGVSYPASAPVPFATLTPANVLPPSASVATPQALIDPSLRADTTNPSEWAHLYRTDQNAFLSSLLASLAAPNPLSTTGPSVEEAFKSHLVSLATPPSNSSNANAASSQATQSNAIPSLYYVLKTFWLPSSPSYFSLTASASTARTPSEHRFLYWDPLPLVFNGIACPSCAQPLINKGRISTGPIKIYDIEKPFFIIGCEYVCNSPQCISSASTSTSSTAGTGRRFSSTDSSIFRSLPTRLKDEFPAKLMYEAQDVGPGANIWNWSAMGVSRPLWNLVKGCLRMGMRKEGVIGLILGVQQGGSVVGGGGIMGAPLVLAAGPVDGSVDHQHHQQPQPAQTRSGGMVEVDEEDMDADNAEDQLRDEPDNHEGQQGPPEGAQPAPEFIQRFIEAYSHTASTPNTQPASSHTVSVSNTPTMRPMASPHIASQNQPLQQVHPQPVPVAVPVQVPTVSMQVQPQPAQPQPSQPQPLPFQQHQQPGPLTQVYDYARPFGNYQYAAYAFFPPSNAATGGSPNLQAAGISYNPQPQPRNPLKRPYPFIDATAATARRASATPSLTAEPHLLTSPQSSHTATPSPNIRHAPRPRPHAQAQAQPQAQAQAPSRITATSSSTSVGGSKTRNPRHCIKCGGLECKGKGGRQYCKSACQDCGKLECQGKNNRRPGEKCDGLA